MTTKRLSHRGLATLALPALLLTLAAPPLHAQNSPAPNPAISPETTLTEAKVAEEGDGDADRAAAGYDRVIRQFDAQRRAAAEAVFHAGALAIRRNDTERALALHRRLRDEFADFQTLNQRLRQELADSPNPDLRASASLKKEPTSPPAPVTYSMSPELMRRYGLLPPEGGGAPAPAAIAAKTPGGPSPNTSPAPRNPDLPDGPGGFGGIGSGGVIGGSGGDAFGGGEPSPQDFIRGLERRELETKLTTLQAEMQDLHRQLRRAERELRLIEGMPDIGALPIQLIESPRLRQLVSQLEEFKIQVASAPDEESRKSLIQRAESHQAVTQNYLTQSLRPRLEGTFNAVVRELDLTRMEYEEALNRFRALSAPPAPR